MAKEPRGSYYKEEQELKKNPINEFTCSCEGVKPLSFDAFKAHLKLDHKINTDDRNQLKGTRKMNMHMDGDLWHSSSYEWTLESGLKFNQFCKNARAFDDPMRFA